VAIPSVNDNELAVAQYLEQWLNRYDIDTHIDYISGERANLIATYQQHLFHINDHFVQSIQMEEMSNHHGSLHLLHPYVHGRGAADMKSGLAALVIAMIEIKASGQLKHGTIRLG
jgi:succinyl-diaminopimelate desuccinylase